MKLKAAPKVLEIPKREIHQNERRHFAQIAIANSIFEMVELLLPELISSREPSLIQLANEIVTTTIDDLERNDYYKIKNWFIESVEALGIPTNTTPKERAPINTPPPQISPFTQITEHQHLHSAGHPKKEDTF